ncbi:Yip1 family protein [Haliea sp. E17]|uniref:Yip1 family protein n=1 Tax=Haliea sp. E17 TaxID=3401576 RepID=UPI003AB100E2
MIQHAFGLMVRPGSQWRQIAELPESSFRTLLLYPCLLALIPAVAWFYGTTQVGWTVGNGEPQFLTRESARTICILFYLVQLAGVAAIGYFIHWMSDTYGAPSSTIKGIIIAALSATPMFLAGAVGFYPVLWLDLLVGIIAVCWAVYLIYLGIPIIMQIPEERGFLFSSAVMGVALVMMICLMVGTVLLWDFGAAPAFTDQVP